MKALRVALTQSFNESELQTLCADLAIDYENLAGDTKADKARELVAYAQRHGRLPELLAYVRSERPSLGLPATPPASAADDDDTPPSRRGIVVGAGVAALSIVLLALAALQLLPSFTAPAAPNDAPTAATGAASAAETTANRDLEQRLAAVNIRLTFSEDAHVEEVRGYITDPETGYPQLAAGSLDLLGNRRFRQPIALDELDRWYTEAVGEQNYLDPNGKLHAAELQGAMVNAWNDRYGEQQTSLDALLEPRP